MAELNARIIAKASGTTGEEPQAADLEVAELAVNTADGKLFTKHTDNSVVTISGGGGGGATNLDGLTDVSVPGPTFNVIGSGRFDTPLGAFPSGNPGEYYDQPGQNRIFISDTDADSVDMNQFFQGTDQVGNTLQIATDAGFTNLLVDAQITAYSDQSSNNRYYFTWGFDLGFSLTGTIYVRVGEYVTSLVDGQALVYDSGTTQWEPRAVLEDLSGNTIGQLSNVKDDAPTPVTTTWNVIASSGAAAGMPSASAYGGGGGLALHPTSIQGDVKADLEAFIAQLSLPLSATMIVDGTEYALNITAVNDSGIDGTGAYLPKVVFNHDVIGSIPTGGTLELVEFSTFRGQLAATPADGQVLTWVDANNQWEPKTVTGGGSTSLDPYFSSVTVLSSFDGETNGASTWTTYGTDSPTWTTNGAVITNTGTRWGGTTSLDLAPVTTGGTGVPCSLGTDDWTVEAWFYIDTANWNGLGLMLGNGVLSDAHDVIYFGPFSNSYGTKSCRLRLSNNGSNLGEQQPTSGAEWQDQEWMHVAITRLGNRYTGFVNGKQAATVDLGATSLTFDSGTMGTNPEATNIGRMQDFRITRGVARYSGAYYSVPQFNHPTS